MDEKAFATTGFNADELFQFPASFQHGSRVEAFGMHSYSNEWLNSAFATPHSMVSSNGFASNNNSVVYPCGDLTPTADQTVFGGTSGLFVNTSPGHCSSVSTPESLRSDLNCAVSTGSTSVSSILAPSFPLLVQSQLEQDDVFVEKLYRQPALAASAPPPSTEAFAGKYKFKISLPANGGRATSWIYSEKLSKLYVHINSACPIKVHTNNLPYNDCVVRISAVYTRPEHANEPVRCCLQHQGKQGESGARHLIRLSQPDALYADDAGRQSVAVPFRQPADSDHASLLLKFCCFSSCVGGQNRRPIKAVFTLERAGSKSQVLGRCSLEVRVCACPRRDARYDLALAQPAPEVAAQPQQFTLTVRGSENYRLLKRIRDALELADSRSLAGVARKRKLPLGRLRSDLCVLANPAAHASEAELQLSAERDDAFSEQSSVSSDQQSEEM